MRVYSRELASMESFVWFCVVIFIVFKSWYFFYTSIYSTYSILQPFLFFHLHSSFIIYSLSSFIHLTFNFKNLFIQIFHFLTFLHSFLLFFPFLAPILFIPPTFLSLRSFLPFLLFLTQPASVYSFFPSIHSIPTFSISFLEANTN